MTVRSALLAGVWCVAAAPAAPAVAADNPTFTRDVAPILRTHCTDCHRAGGLAPFSLVTYAEVRPWARAIRQATAARTMPPWKPAPGHGGPFAGERRLDDADVALIARWVEQGAVEGDPSELAAPPVWSSGWPLGPPDLVLALPEPYALAAGGEDEYRNFVLPVPLSAARYVRAFDFRPGGRAIHHARLLVDSARSARRLDRRDPAPGYDDALDDDARFPDGHLLAWAPGRLPAFEPEDLAWRLDPGVDLVMQLHLPASDVPARISPAVGLYFADAPATRSPTAVLLGDKTIDIPAGAARHVVEDAFRLPVDAEVLSLYPHAHYLGRDLQGFAILPDGSRRWLVRIDGGGAGGGGGRALSARAAPEPRLRARPLQPGHPARRGRLAGDAAELDVRPRGELAPDDPGGRRHDAQHLPRRRPRQAVQQPADDAGDVRLDQRDERRDGARRRADQHHSARGGQQLQRVALRQHDARGPVAGQLQRTAAARRRQGGDHAEAGEHLRRPVRVRRADPAGPDLVLHRGPAVEHQPGGPQRHEPGRLDRRRRQPHPERPGPHHHPGDRHQQVDGVHRQGAPQPVPRVQRPGGSRHGLDERRHHQLLQREHQVDVDHQHADAAGDRFLLRRAGGPVREPGRHRRGAAGQRLHVHRIALPPRHDDARAGGHAGAERGGARAAPIPTT